SWTRRPDPALFAEAVLPDAVTKLIIAEAECLCRLALVPAVAAEMMLKHRPLVRLYRSAQITDRVEFRDRRARSLRRHRRGSLPTSPRHGGPPPTPGSRHALHTTDS